MHPSQEKFDGFAVSRLLKRAALSLCMLLPGIGCYLSPSPCGVPSPAPAIDWQEAAIQVQRTFDITNATVTDEELTAIYTTGDTVATVRRVDITGDRYMLLVNDAARTQAIAIPGTNFSHLNDDLADLNTLLIYDTDLEAFFHAGFLNDAHDVRNDVTPLLNMDYETTIAGYSLGGSIAAIVSLFLEDSGYNIRTVITFGQPKVTDPGGAAKFAGHPLFRFIAASDGVPDLFWGPYVHFGQQVILLDGLSFVYMNTGDPNFAYSTDLLAQNIAGTFNLNDHATYPARIASKQGSPPQQVPYCDRLQYITMP